MKKASMLLIFIFYFYKLMEAHAVDLDDIQLLEISTNKMVPLGSLNNNKPMYIKFWASWCGPCNDQMPHFQHAYSKYKSNVDFVSVNLAVSDSASDVKAVQENHKLSMPQYMDTTGELAAYFDVVGTPYHILLNKDGFIKHLGHDASSDLDAKLDALFKGAASNTIGSRTQAMDSNVKKKITEGKSAILFSAAWCHTYLKKSRPERSENCRNAAELVNELQQEHGTYQWSVIVSRLWTGGKELDAFTKSFQLTAPAYVDSENELFQKFEVKEFPTLLLLENGKETLRIENFENPSNVHDAIRNGSALGL